MLAQSLASVSTITSACTATRDIYL